MKLAKLALIASLTLAPAAIFAQTPTPGQHDYDINQRKVDQQDRIAQGVKSGQLTAGETAKLEDQQRDINQQVHADRQANGGKLTPGEKKQVNSEQNHASKNIYKKKHNANTRAAKKS